MTWTMNVYEKIRRRQLGFRNTKINLDFAFDRLKLDKSRILDSQNQLNDFNFALNRCGPLACAKSENILAIACEDGNLNLVNASDLSEISNWLGHNNAVFDVKWQPSNKRIMTASGDLSLVLWDVKTGNAILEFPKAHHSSIRSISFYDENLVASCSRDGSIKLHDLRTSTVQGGVVGQIIDAHRSKSKPLNRSRRRSDIKCDPTSCVTSVAFDPFLPRIFSTGANDATIKLWDLRKHKSNTKARRSDGIMSFSNPALTIRHPQYGNCYHGYSYLQFSSCRLYAACSDNKIYSYDRFVYSDEDQPESIQYSGFRFDNYSRISLLRDEFLIGGSKKGGAIVWSLNPNYQSNNFHDRPPRPQNSQLFQTQNIVDQDESERIQNRKEIKDIEIEIEDIDDEHTKFPSSKSNNLQKKINSIRMPLGQLTPDDNDENDTTVVESDWDSLSIFTCRDDSLVCKWTIQ